MSYPRRALKIQPRAAKPDAPSFEIRPDDLTFTQNVLFRDGWAECAPSANAVYEDLLTDVYALHNMRIGGINYWVYHGTNKSSVVEGSTHTDLTIAGGLQNAANNHQWTVGLLNGVPFANNGLDVPMYWDGMIANKFVALPGWPAGTVCAGIFAHRFHLFALAINGPSGNFPEQVLWSDKAAPGNVPATWAAAANNEAGDNVISDTPGRCITAANLGRSLIIYKEQSTHAVDYIGDASDEIFNFRTLFSQLGALSRHSIADINGRHFVVTDGDIVLNDGVRPRSIAYGQRRKDFFDSLDQENYERHFVVYNRGSDEVWLCFPTAGETIPNRAMIYNVKSGDWGDRDLSGISTAAIGIVNDTAPDESWNGDPEAWDDATKKWDQQNFSLARSDLVLAEPQVPAEVFGRLLRLGGGNGSRVSIMRKDAIDFGEPLRFKNVKRVYMNIEATPDVVFTVRVGGRETADGPTTWAPPETMTSADPFVSPVISGRFIDWEATVDTEKPWRLPGASIEYTLKGYH